MKISVSDLSEVISKLPDAKTYQLDEVRASVRHIQDNGDVKVPGGMTVVFQKNKEKNGWDLLLTTHSDNPLKEEAERVHRSNQ